MAVDLAWFVVCAGLAPSEYRNLTRLERQAIRETVEVIARDRR